MNDQEQLNKSAQFKQRDAARKREARRRAKEEKEKLAALELARQQLSVDLPPLLQSAPSPLEGDHDLVRARAMVKVLLDTTQKDVEAMILNAEIVSAQAKAAAHQVENQAREKARLMEREAETWARITKQKCLNFVKKTLDNVQQDLPSHVQEDPQAVLNFVEGLPDPTVPETSEEARLKRRREDANRRQRKFAEKKKKLKLMEQSSQAGGGDGLDIGPIRSRGARSASSARFVAKFVLDTFDSRTAKCSVEFKSAVWNRIWSNTRLQGFLPTAFSNAKEANAMVACFRNMQGALQHTKKGARKDHLAAKYTLLSGLVNKTTLAERHGRTICNMLQIKQKNLLAAADRREALDSDKATAWPLGARKTKSGRNLLSADVKQLVVEWWTAESRVLPGRKDIIRRRVDYNLYEIHIIQILDETQSEFFGRFTARYPEVRISQRSFENLKPYFVRVLKDRYVCCCQAHVQMDYIKDALNAMRVKLHRTEICTCQCLELCLDPEPLMPGHTPCCKAHSRIYTSVTELWESCVCPKREGKAWHALKCINSECTECGIHKLALCPSEVDPEVDREVLWRAFEKIEIYPNNKTPRGREVKDSKRIKLIHKRTHPLDLVSFVRKKLPHYIKHNFRAKWETRAYQECLKSFPRGVVVSVIDFAENYSFQIQHEIQSMHWHSDQITLLIHITYRHDMTKHVTADRDIIKNYHVYISDDKEHDATFVHHCLERHANWLESEKVVYNEHWVWSDGAASQFKCARNFYWIARHPLNHQERTMRWFFFGSGHGKGEHDGAGGVIKRALRFEQLRTDSVKLQNAADACKFLQDKFSICESGTRRYFWLIEKDAVKHKDKWGCKTLAGSANLHVFIGCNPRSSTFIKTRSLACMCSACIYGDDACCENEEWCGVWSTQELTPSSIVAEAELCTRVLRSQAQEKDSSAVANDSNVQVGSASPIQAGNENIERQEAEDEEEEEEGDEPVLSLRERATLIQRGDNFAVKAAQPNMDNATFYVLKCEQPLQVLKREHTDDHWGDKVVFKPGDAVVIAKYYQQVKSGNFQRYMLLNDRPSAMFLAETIVYVNFSMPPYKGGKGKNKRFKLEVETLDAITSAIDDEETGDEEGV